MDIVMTETLGKYRFLFSVNESREPICRASANRLAVEWKQRRVSVVAVSPSKGRSD